MTLTKSCNNGLKQWWSIYVWSIKKQSCIGIIYFILLCLALPFLIGVILFSSIKNTYHVDIESIVSYFGTLFPILIVPGTLLFVFIISIILFRYMHNKRSTDFYHTLPISRNAMFFGRYFAGLTILVVPMILCCCVTALVLACLQGPAQIAFIPYGTLFVYMAYLLLIIASTYTFTTFIAICSGTTFNMIISTIAISIAYPMLTWMLFTTIDFLLPGFTYMKGYTSVFTAGTPYLASILPMFYVQQSGADMSLELITYISWWISITVVLLLATWLLYRFRKSENAEGRKAYPIPQIIIRTMVSGAVGIGLGYLLYASIGGTVFFFIGLVLGAVIAHVIVEVLYARGFKTLLKSTPYLAGFFVLYGIFYAILATGCFGYDTKVPLASQVESVDVTVDNIPNTDIIDMNGRKIASIMPIHITDKATIDATIDWHKNTVKTNREGQYPYVFSNYAKDGKVNYHLKDGSTLTREIEISRGSGLSRSGDYNQKNIEKLFTSKETLEQQEEFIKKSNLIFYIEPGALNTVKVTTGKEQNAYVEAAGQKDMLIQMLQQDVLRRKTQDSAQSIKTGYTDTFDHRNNTDAASIDPNAITVSIALNPFTPSQNGYVRDLIGDYEGEVQFLKSNLKVTISPEAYPNTYQYLLDNGFIKKT